MLPEANHFRFDFFLAHSGLWRLQISILDGCLGLLDSFRAFLEVILARLDKLDFGLLHRSRTSHRDPIVERRTVIVALVLRVMNLPNPTGVACCG